MKKILFLMLCLMCFLTGCNSEYTSKYSGMNIKTSQTGNSCSITFKSFEGKYVFKVRKRNPGEGDIEYTASLEKGTINVYYNVAILDNKLNLFTINSGESLSDSAGYIEDGQLVYIIVETDGKCENGTFSFNLN